MGDDVSDGIMTSASESDMVPASDGPDCDDLAFGASRAGEKGHNVPYRRPREWSSI